MWKRQEGTQTARRLTLTAPDVPSPDGDGCGTGQGDPMQDSLTTLAPSSSAVNVFHYPSPYGDDEESNGGSSMRNSPPGMPSHGVDSLPGMGGEAASNFGRRAISRRASQLLERAKSRRGTTRTSSGLAALLAVADEDVSGSPRLAWSIVCG